MNINYRENKKTSLPQGWVECELKDLLDLQNGYAFSSKDYVKKSNTLNIRMSNIRPNGVFDETHNIKYLPDDYVDKYKDYILKNGDLIIAMTDMADNSKILGVPTVVSYRNNKHVFLMNQRVGRLTSFSNNVYIPFIKLILISPKVRSIYKSKGKGGLQLNLSKNDILSMEIILPPLNEQKRIVEKIEEEFAKIDEGIEKLKLTQEQIKQYKQSVLNQQFKIKNTETVALNYVTKKINDGTHKTPTYTETGIPFISVKDIRNKQIYFDNCKYITKEEHEILYKRCNPQKGDVLITKSGTIGRTAIIKNDKIFDLFVSVALLKPDADKITSDFLMYSLDNYINHIDIKQDVKGGVIKNLHIEDLKKIEINLPTLDEQTQIVKEIEKRFEVADKAEKVITNNLEKAQQLKQSILKKAFEGRLVPQDANDEPASVLLEKIKTERGKNV